MRENEPEKLKNKLLITDYAKVKKIKNKAVAINHMQTMTATLSMQAFK